MQTYPVVIFFLTQHKLYAIMIAFATFAVAKMVFCAKRCAPFLGVALYSYLGICASSIVS